MKESRNGREIAIMMGFPLSGKSTHAQAFRLHQDFVIVCPDTVRLALHGHQFIPTAEDFIWATVRTMVRSLYMEGHSVLVDACHVSKGSRKYWVNLARDLKTTLKIFWVDTPVETCYERNEKIGRLDPKVIERMHMNFEEPSSDEGIIFKLNTEKFEYDMEEAYFSEG